LNPLHANRRCYGGYFLTLPILSVELACCYWRSPRLTKKHTLQDLHLCLRRHSLFDDMLDDYTKGFGYFDGVTKPESLRQGLHLGIDIRLNRLGSLKLNKGLVSYTKR